MSHRNLNPDPDKILMILQEGGALTRSQIVMALSECTDWSEVDPLMIEPINRVINQLLDRHQIHHAGFTARGWTFRCATTIAGKAVLA